MNICAASGVAARLDLDAIPLLPGAMDLGERGIASTLKPQNEAALAGRIGPSDHPALPLLFDPQTAGGLLAAVPADKVDATLTALARTETPGTVIGQITEGAPSLDLS